MSAAPVVVFRSYDPVAIELAEAQLRAAGLPFTRAGRGNAALLGAGNTIIEQQLEVHAEHAADATALLAADAEPDPQAAPDPGDGPAVEPYTRKLAFIAAGASLVWPGLGAVYVGLPLTGFVIAVWSFVALVRAPEGPDPLGILVFGHVLPRAIDLLGSQRWLRRRGRRGVGLLPQTAIALGVAAASYFSHQLLAGSLSQLVSSLGRSVALHEWPFDQAPAVAAISDSAVLEGAAPALLVIHYADDHSWAFLSDTAASEDDQQVVSMEAALTLDPTLRSIASLPPGWMARRDVVGGPWTREVQTDDE